MSYIGNPPLNTAFLTDTFTGNGSTTAFTMSVAPANTASVLVSVSGVLQTPSTYSVNGTTLTFSSAPPSGTGNISVRYLGIPASGVTTTAYRTQTEFTATAGQTTFTPPSYTVGFIDVYRNGVKLGTADFTASNGTTVVLATGATAGDLVTTVSFLVSSVLNAIPNTAGAIGIANLSATGTASSSNFLRGDNTWATPIAGVIQVKQGQTSTQQSFGNNTWTDLTGLTVGITPTSSSNKILVLATVWINSDTPTANLYGRLNRNGTIVGTASNDTAGYAGNGGWRVLSDAQDANYNIHNIGFTWLDSPASTSALTYKIQGLTNAGNFYFNKSGSGSYFYMYSTITVMEVLP